LHTIIAENDESQWKDEAGTLYHFPKRYAKYLEPGTQLIYYKGRIQSLQYRSERLADQPHYFATGVVGKVFPDKDSTKGDLFATILDYTPFNKPVMAKNDGVYVEVIPDSQKSNYWRNGVRPADESVFDSILSEIYSTKDSFPSSNALDELDLNDANNGLESGTEGQATSSYGTTYERNPKYRRQAIAIHGCSCIACGFNFGEVYGDYAEGFIHIHHIIPVSQLDVPTSIDPETDLVPLCANCHSVVHRRKAQTLSVEELKVLINAFSRKR